jgi:hypothetical protein
MSASEKYDINSHSGQLGTATHALLQCRRARSGSVQQHAVRPDMEWFIHLPLSKASQLGCLSCSAGTSGWRRLTNTVQVDHVTGQPGMMTVACQFNCIRYRLQSAANLHACQPNESFIQTLASGS